MSRTRLILALIVVLLTTCIASPRTAHAQTGTDDPAPCDLDNIRYFMRQWGQYETTNEREMRDHVINAAYILMLAATHCEDWEMYAGTGDSEMTLSLERGRYSLNITYEDIEDGGFAVVSLPRNDESECAWVGTSEPDYWLTDPIALATITHTVSLRQAGKCAVVVRSAVPWLLVVIKR